jgi:hypothetical protein
MLLNETERKVDIEGKLVGLFFKLDLTMTFWFDGTEYPVWNDVNKTLFWVPGWTTGPFMRIVRDKYGYDQEMKYYNNTYVYRNRSIFLDLNEMDITGRLAFSGSTVGADDILEQACP